MGLGRRYTRPLLTRRDLELDGPAIRIRDLAHISGCSPDTLRSDIEAGHLVATQHHGSPKAPYMVERQEALRWLQAAFPVKQTA